MRYLFISDLHLSAQHPRLVRGFLSLLAHHQQPSKPNDRTHLYILGDWFNVWIGDDDPSPWLNEIVAALQNFVAAGNQVYFLVGNRDFALQHAFLQQFSGQLITDGHVIDIAGQRYRLEHGDALCTDDVDYQRFKKIIRNPLLLGFLRRLPLTWRRALANGFRHKSNQQVQYKTANIMDVNATAVEQALAHVDVLVHGHTHRPQIHRYPNHKRRIVLGDWREQSGEAYILEISDDAAEQFFCWRF